MPEYPKFRFWYTWLLSVSILSVVTGLIIALFPGSFMFEHHTTALEQSFFDGQMDNDADHMRRFFFGIIGGTIAGYFLLQTFIVIYAFKKREIWSWYAILLAILLWFITDSILSLWHGAFFNVWMINIPSLALTIVPLAMTRRYFHKSGPN
jgi:hypothetical protein